ncbi:hypothetical protein K488DRAFT_67153 [Vararia minispora EC-137]|uniref:Uncharacterized protein n=1 Tax=Vararia minispora EC-137 TaxID=1314806 RepID=A0ACB8QZ91_9AGAM|nr:hypothetical protein K488DRAFT_67153 [Vararia minispora EC-137]
MPKASQRRVSRPDGDAPYRRKGNSSRRRSTAKSRAKLKPKVLTFDLAKWHILEKHADRGRRTVSFKSKKVCDVQENDFIRVEGEDVRGEDGDMNPSVEWIGRVEEIGLERTSGRTAGTSTTLTWLKVRWLYCEDDLFEEMPMSNAEDVMLSSRFGALERAWSDLITVIPMGSVLGLTTVCTFDDRCLYMESDDEDIPMEGSFYTRSDYNSETKELKTSRSPPFGKFIKSPSVCGIKECEEPWYCADGTYSQVFCARFGCCMWYHADCVKGSTNRTWYPSADVHARGRMLAYPEPTVAVRRMDAAHFDPHALLSNVLADPEQQDLLIALAEQPIVRPTRNSVAGNVRVVLKARSYIRDARRHEMDVKMLEELEAWLRGFDLRKVQWETALARARAAGVEQDYLVVAAMEGRTYELLHQLHDIGGRTTRIYLGVRGQPTSRRMAMISTSGTVPPATPITSPISLCSPKYPELELRTATLDDVPAIINVFISPANTALDPVVNDPAVFTVERVTKMVEGWARSQKEEKPGRVSVVVVVEGIVQGIGGMGYIGTDATTGARTGDAGVMLNEAVRGRGYGSEAMRLTMNFAFDVLKLDKVTATMLAKNVPMVGLMRKMGWEGRHIPEGEGEWGEEWMFSMLPEQRAQMKSEEA